MERSEREERRSAWGRRQLENFEKRLLEERRRAIAQMQEFGDQFTSAETGEGELATWRFHMADEGTDTFDREQNFLLASREGRLIWQIDRALRRLYRSPESFGRCEECGKLIPYERLDAIPYVVTCMSCKQGWERRERQDSRNRTPALEAQRVEL